MGSAAIESSPEGINSPQALLLNNTNALFGLAGLDLGPDNEITGLSIQMKGDGSGTPINLGVNGFPPYVGLGPQLPPNLPGGIVAEVIPGGDPSLATLNLTGNINSLEIGGNIALGNLCVSTSSPIGGDIAGCTYAIAINFNPNATVDNGTCQFDLGGGEPCENDSDGDGVCDEDEVPGCTGPCACNYNPQATDDDGSCQEPDALGMCGGFCPADVDGDGECDDEDCCVGGYDECGVCNGPGAIYPCGCNPIPLGACDCDGNMMDALGNCGGDCTADADSDGICDDVDDCVGMMDICGVCNGPGPIFICGCTPLTPGDCDCEGNQLDALGICGGDCPGDIDGDGVCDTNEVPGCTNPLACNFNLQATDDNGSCEFAPPGLACNGSCLYDADNDGVCDGDELYGCTEEAACNYNPQATELANCIFPAPGYGCDGECLGDADDDGICDANEIPGCLDPDACNHNPQATDENGACNYAPTGFDCLGNCLNDNDGDGICDELESLGCNYPQACNYNPEALENDGTCIFPPFGYDCAGTCLNDEDGDGVCDAFEVPGCMDPIACNYNPQATQPEPNCQFPPLGYFCDGSCSDFDGDGVCDVDEITGCTYPTADNFSPNATEEDGTCLFSGGSSGCPDLDGDGQVAVGDLLEMLGQFGQQVDC